MYVLYRMGVNASKLTPIYYDETSKNSSNRVPGSSIKNYKFLITAGAMPAFYYNDTRRYMSWGVATINGTVSKGSGFSECYDTGWVTETVALSGNCWRVSLCKFKAVTITDSTGDHTKFQLLTRQGIVSLGPGESLTDYDATRAVAYDSIEYNEDQGVFTYLVVDCPDAGLDIEKMEMPNDTASREVTNWMQITDGGGNVWSCPEIKMTRKRTEVSGNVGGYYTGNFPADITLGKVFKLDPDTMMGYAPHLFGNTHHRVVFFGSQMQG
jgi:hypothetical protein